MANTEDQEKARIEAKKDEIAAKHDIPRKKVHRFAAGGAEVFFRSPTRAAWKRFGQSSALPAQRMEALEVLAIDCLLDPDHKAFAALLEDKPALGMVFGDELVGLAGAAEVVEKNA